MLYRNYLARILSSANVCFSKEREEEEFKEGCAAMGLGVLPLYFVCGKGVAGVAYKLLQYAFKG